MHQILTEQELIILIMIKKSLLGAFREQLQLLQGFGSTSKGSEYFKAFFHG